MSNYTWAKDRLPELYEKRMDPQYGGIMMSHPSGWDELVLELDEKLNELVPDYQLVQSKQKFGGLRYYIHFEDELGDLWDEVHELVREYEYKSFEICEFCGGPAETRTIRGYITTVCDEHYDQEKARLRASHEELERQLKKQESTEE